MTGKDTLAVKQLVDKFFTYAKEKNFTEAAGMLYRAANDLKEEPQPLNNDEMAEVKHMLELFPMVDYRIEYIKFDEANLNEVLCYVIMKLMAKRLRYPPRCSSSLSTTWVTGCSVSTIPNMVTKV